jgi:hypothetical protein
VRAGLYEPRAPRPAKEPDRTDLKENGSRSPAMTGPSASPHAPADHSEGAVSVLLVIGAAVLIGLGLTGMAFWLITFHWLFLASVVPLAGGGLLLFTRATGPDRA